MANWQIVAQSFMVVMEVRVATPLWSMAIRMGVFMSTGVGAALLTDSSFATAWP